MKFKKPSKKDIGKLWIRQMLKWRPVIIPKIKRWRNRNEAM